MLVAQQWGLVGLLHQPGQQLLRDGPAPTAVPGFLLNVKAFHTDSSSAQTHESAIQHVVVELLHQLPLTADRVHGLQQQRSQQFPRWDRRPAQIRIQPAEVARQFFQRAVGQCLDLPQRMVGRDAFFGEM